MREKYTSLIFKQRQLSEDDVDIMIGGREYVPIETMEYQIQEGIAGQKIKSYFTIGVIVEASQEKATKNGKKYKLMKISDLVKYDTVKVKKHLEK